MINVPTWIPVCDSRSPARLDFFLYSDASICSTMTFPLLEILIMLSSQFPMTFRQTQKGGALFHCIAYVFTRAGWCGL